jgi:hypothetical protein
VIVRRPSCEKRVSSCETGEQGENSQIGTLVFDRCVERETTRLYRPFDTCYALDKPRSAQSIPKKRILVNAEGVEVGAKCAVEEDGVLRDDGELLSELSEAESANVDAVDFDGAGADFDEAEEGHGDGGLARSGAVGRGQLRLRSSANAETHRPTIPTFSPPLTSTERPVKTSGRPLR